MTTLEQLRHKARVFRREQIEADRYLQDLPGILDNLARLEADYARVYATPSWDLSKSHMADYRRLLDQVQTSTQHPIVKRQLIEVLLREYINQLNLWAAKSGRVIDVQSTREQNAIALDFVVVVL